MKRTPKHLSTLYLYPDGHAVGVFETTHSPSGKRVEWVEIWESFGGVRRFDKGRLIVSTRYGNALYGIVEMSTRISAQEDRVIGEFSSGHSKQANCPLGGVTFDTPAGRLQFNTCSYVSGDFTFQPEAINTETFNPDLAEWSIYRVAKVHRAKEGSQRNYAYKPPYRVKEISR